MQKTIRINILARNAAAKKMAKGKKSDTRQEWKDWHAGTNRLKATHGQFVQEERLHRRQDWIAGPLAPNRNSGMTKGVYGTTEMELSMLPDIPKSVRAAPHREGYAAVTKSIEFHNRGFKGDTIVGNVVAGDRVVIVAGPERLRGLIGTVEDVNNVKESVKLTDINTADVRIPAYTQPPAADDDTPPAKHSAIALPIPMSHVRLVGKTWDNNGKASDVIFRHVHAGPPYVQRPMGSHLPSHTRYLTGTDSGAEIVIPWPDDVITDDFVYHDGDTTRTAVSATSWTPSLFHAPLGYTTDIPETLDSKDDSYTRSQELLTIDVKGPEGLSNIQRAGIAGFVDTDKLIARQQRIADGIMNEFRGKFKTLNTRHDDSIVVKKKIIEDARSIWYQERKLISPASQAAELAVQQRAQALQKKLNQEKEKTHRLKDLVKQMQRSEIESGRKSVESNSQHGHLKVLEGLGLPVDTGVAFFPDRRLQKKLRKERERIEEAERQKELEVRRKMDRETRREKALLSREVRETLLDV